MTSDPIGDFHQALLAERGLDPMLHAVSGVSVVPDDDRAETGIASGYVLGDRFMIWCDPAVADRVTGFEVPSETAAARLDAWASFGNQAGAEHVGTGIMRVLGTDGVGEPGRAALEANRAQVVAIESGDAADLARLAAFVEAADADDLDEAEIEPDDPDPVIRCAETPDAGALTAYASARPWDGLPRWWDIGVLTLREYRGRGLGLACVVATADALVADGRLPLYRHNGDNVGSAALADRAGFVVAAELAAIRFT